VAVTVLLLSAWTGESHASDATAAIARPEVTVAIEVVDDQGAAVPAAEVWRVSIPGPGESWGLDIRTDFSLSFLDRVAARFADVPEFTRKSPPDFFSAFDNFGRSNFRQLAPTDPNGQTTETLFFSSERPLPLTLKYYALEYGYVPAAVQVETTVGTNPRPQKLILYRDPRIVLPKGKYWKRFLAIESAPWCLGKSLPLSDKCIADIRTARTALAEITRDAETAGDRKSASRILAWTAFAPDLSTNDRFILITGEGAVDAHSQQSLDALAKAVELDPDNRFARMALLLEQPPANRGDHIHALAALTTAGCKGLWPEIYRRLENEYLADGQRDKAKQTFEEQRACEPEANENRALGLKYEQARYDSLDEFRKDFIPDGNPDYRDTHGGTPLGYAVRSGRVELLEWLLRLGATRPTTHLAFDALLNGAIDSCSPDMVRRVLAFSADIRDRPEPDFRDGIGYVDRLLKDRVTDDTNLQAIRKLLVDARTASTAER
jgi:hypothetical protein